MKWKVTFIVLALIICLSLSAVMILTLERTVAIGDGLEYISIKYQDFIIMEQGAERIVTEYRGQGSRVVIPDGITKIGARVFYRNPNLTEIIMPDSVRVIGNGAFLHSTNLTRVQLSENLEIIDSRAFEFTDSLTNITIPTSVKQIGISAFGNSGLRSVTIMGDAPSFPGRNTFEGNPSLINVVIHGDIIEIEAIGSLTFQHSMALTSLTIYGDIYNNAIATDAFENHANLTIYGGSGSNLEAFARENNYRFAVIDDTRPPVSYNPFAEPITVIINGKTLEFDVLPISVNGRILVPLRPIFEEMGATVDWNKDGWQTATATRDDMVVLLTIGDTSPTINGQVVSIDQPGMIVNERTLAPLRFVAEAFGGTVVWDDESQTAYITK